MDIGQAYFERVPTDAPRRPRALMALAHLYDGADKHASPLLCRRLIDEEVCVCVNSKFSSRFQELLYRLLYSKLGDAFCDRAMSVSVRGTHTFLVFAYRGGRRLAITIVSVSPVRIYRVT